MIQVLKCGYESRHKHAFDLVRKEGVANYILLLVKTDAYFELNDTIEFTKPNMAILFPPNTYIHYGSEKAHFNDDWIHFSLKGEKFLSSYTLPLNEPIYIPYLSKLSSYIRLIVQEDQLNSENREKILDYLMHSLLYSMNAQYNELKKQRPKHFTLMSQLRSDILNAPHKEWTVSSMSQKVHMSPSYFQALYKELFGISCVQDLIHARLENAKFYLNTTDMTIQSLSTFCGYKNELHFMRQFKKYEGVTPSQYRSYVRCETNNL